MSVDMMEEFDFGSAEGATVAQEANKGGDFAREVEYLSLKADAGSVAAGKNRAIVRVLTEFERKPWMDGTKVTPFNYAWITVAQHYAPTKPKPEYVKPEAKWPQKWNAVCRKDKVFAKKFGGACYICDNLNSKPTNRTWALAVEREQVIENGQIIGIRDKMREVLDRDANGDLIVEREENGKKIYKKKMVPAWLILNFGWKNFFGNLAGQGQYFQTVMDSDYVITRTGEDNNDTNYSFVRLDPIYLPEGNSFGLPAGTKYDLSLIVGQDETGRQIPLREVVYPDMPDLRRIISEKTSDDYYGRYFVPGWLPKGFDPSKVQTGQQGVQNGVQQQGGYQPVQQGGYQQVQPQQAPAPAQPTPPQQQAAEPSQASLDALRNRVLGNTQPQ